MRGRDALYCARAFETPDLAVEARGLRCERDAEGNCIRTHSCAGPGGASHDCLAPFEPLTWSSPIYVDFTCAASGTELTRTRE